METRSSAASRSPERDASDHALIRQLLRMTPTQRLETVAAYWPLVRVGLRRRGARGRRRP